MSVCLLSQSRILRPTKVLSGFVIVHKTENMKVRNSIVYDLLKKGVIGFSSNFKNFSQTLQLLKAEIPRSPPQCTF